MLQWEADKARRDEERKRKKEEAEAAAYKARLQAAKKKEEEEKVQTALILAFLAVCLLRGSPTFDRGAAGGAAEEGPCAQRSCRKKRGRRPPARHRQVI